MEENLQINLYNKNKNLVGEVISVKDGVAFVTGLPNIRVGEMVQFLNKSKFLEADKVGVIVFGDDKEIKKDYCLLALNRLVDVDLEEELLGRVVDSLGTLIDGGLEIKLEKRLNIGVGNQVINNSYGYRTKTCLNNMKLGANIVKRGMRKSAQQTILTIAQKKEISNNIFTFIKDVLDKTTKREELVPNVVSYFTNKALGEHILNQSIAKGFFPKLTFFKKEAISAIGNAPKLSLQNPNDKSDVRSIPEILLANTFANTQNKIDNICLNSENPKLFTTFTARSTTGNNVNDLTITIPSGVGLGDITIPVDVKIGNNAHTGNSSILGYVPTLSDGSVYTVLCNKIEDLSKIHYKRVDLIRSLVKKEDISPVVSDVFFSISSLPLDDISRNILIQDQLLKMIGGGVIKRTPAFFVGYEVRRQEIEISYFKKMETYINGDIFNSKEDFHKLARAALKAYYESVREANREKIFDTNLFKDTGFSQIDVEGLLN